MDKVKVDRLYSLSLQIKELEAEATLIKDELKSELVVGVHLFDDRKVTITECKRESLDKDGLKVLLGEDVLKDFIKTTEYKTVSVK